MNWWLFTCILAWLAIYGNGASINNENEESYLPFVQSALRYLNEEGSATYNYKTLISAKKVSLLKINFRSYRK